MRHQNAATLTLACGNNNFLQNCPCNNCNIDAILSMMKSVMSSSTAWSVADQSTDKITTVHVVGKQQHHYEDPG